MSTPEPEFDRGFDAELRAVPLPAGLLRRLRETALADDADLDAVLRDVAVPGKLPDRLRAAVCVDDAGLDAVLRDVAPPDGFSARLRAALLADDDFFDETLRDVPIPKRIGVRLRKASGRPQPVERWMRFATALSLFLALGLLYFAGVMLTISRSPSVPEDLPTEGSIAKTRPPAPDDFLLPDDPGLTPPPESGLVEMPPPQPPPESAPDRAAPSDELRGLLARWHGGSGPDPMLDVTPYLWGKEVLGYVASEVDSLPDLRRVAGPTPQGMQPPLVQGFDVLAFNQTGVFPFVLPAAHPRLRTWNVPLGADRASYELTRRYLEKGELAPADKIRTEEFLAALDYEFPVPKRQPLGLTTFAGPSPFVGPSPFGGGDGFDLLQCGVQARSPAADKHAPLHLVVALDASASMQWAGRIDMVRRELAALVRRLEPADRLSLVTFNGEATVRFADVGPEEADAMIEVLMGVPIQGSTNVGAGLLAAYGVAAQTPASERQARVVLLTDGTAESDRATGEIIEHRLAGPAGRSIRLDVIDIGEQSSPNYQLRRFASAGRGQAFQAASAQQINWALVEITSGRSSRVASDVRLSVTFNPKTVYAYRCFGHEPSALGRLVAEQPKVDFHAGQQATALFELRLTAATDAEIATAELSWQTAEGSPRQKLVQRLLRKDIAATFAQAAPSLQAAAVAARAAEILRTPRGGRGSRQMAELLSVARGVSAALDQRPSFTDFLVTLEQAEKARPHRR